MQSNSELQNKVQRLLAEARRQGATAAQVVLDVEAGLSVTARLGEVETIEHHLQQSVGITIYKGNKKGTATSTDLGWEATKQIVTAACSIADFASTDPHQGLPDEQLLATKFCDLDKNHPWHIQPQEAITIAKACEQSALEAHSEISNSEGATVSSHQSTTVLGNSLGFLQADCASVHSISCAVLAQRDGKMQRDHWYSVARDHQQLQDTAAIGRKAAQLARARLGASRLNSRKCPVLYSANVAAGLLGSFVAAVSGGNLYRSLSFLCDSLGAQLFPQFVRIHELPHLQQGLGSSNYDSEGVATKPRDIVADGVLQGFVLGSYAARKLGLQSTGNAGGVHNLTIASGEQDFAAMLRLLDTGFLVTELMGSGVNILTGDYSRGACGFWVENGQIIHPVEGVTIASNLQDMLQNIIAVGSDVDYRKNIRTGAILLEQMSLAGS